MLELYKDLHPESIATIEDIKVLTLNTLLVSSIYNDLGFIAEDKVILLVEAQSRWDENLPLRMLFYLIDTHKNYMHEKDLSMHQISTIKLPYAELYIIDTDFKNYNKHPDTMSLKDICFDGLGTLDLKIKVLRTFDDTIVGQYVNYCKVVSEVYDKLDMRNLSDEEKLEAARMIFDICITQGFLSKFFKANLHEVINMYEMLFDEKEIQRAREIDERHAREEKERFEKELAQSREELAQSKEELIQSQRKIIESQKKFIQSQKELIQSREEKDALMVEKDALMVEKDVLMVEKDALKAENERLLKELEALRKK